MKFLCWLLISFISLSCGKISRQSGKSLAIVDSLISEWHRSETSAYCGKWEKHDDAESINWSSLYDTTLLMSTQVKSKNTFRASLTCTDDTLEQIQYANGIIVEKGRFVTDYWFCGSFIPTLNGVKPLMSSSQVKSIMGKPLFEQACRLSYRTEEGNLGPLFFFRDDKLWAIFYEESSCDID